MSDERRTPLSAFFLFLFVTVSVGQYCLQREVTWMTDILHYAEQQVREVARDMQDQFAGDAV
ncbi:hypothetical protein EYC98_11870 [Halieaceae bacterium IMCC14734]|uniref:Uncharacterized protein n=2 Tax=Candidatus Litorirhabdus singularis TaxID=2518993 RepID=A0ABT3THT2_9GAMM|nr:hypothetical protein [Candidatus Litorirhabdus singularis]